MKTFEAVLQSLISLTEARIGGASDRDGHLEWLESAVASAAAEIRQLGIDAQSSPVPQQKVGVRMHRNTNHTRWQAKRSRRQAVSQSGSQAPKDPIEEPPARASRRRAAADSNPPTTQETTEAAPEEVPPQRVTRARARRPKSDAPATHVVTRKTRARARRGAKTDAERPSIAVAASELGDVGTTVGVLEQIVEEHESPAAPSSAPPSPPPMASPEREAAALDAPSPPGHADEPPQPPAEQPPMDATPPAPPLPSAPLRTPLSVPAHVRKEHSPTVAGAMLASCSRVRRPVLPSSKTDDSHQEAVASPTPVPQEAAACAPQLTAPAAPSLASNVVATIRSFLPAAKPLAPPVAAGKKPIKVGHV